MRRALLRLLAHGLLAQGGDGLVRPLNAPPAPDLGYGVQPGISPGITVATQVIVFGPGQSILVYNGAPAAGNLVMSQSTLLTRTADKFGNTVFPSLTELALISGAWYAMNTFQRIITLYTATVSEGGPWTVQSSIAMQSGTGLTISELIGNGLTLSTTGTVVIQPLGGVTNIDGQFLATGGIPAAATLIETDTWNPITLDAGWTALAGHPAPGYRLLPDGNVQLTGYMSHAAFAAATPVNSANPLPALYRPATTQYYPGDSNRSGWQIGTTGIVTAEPLGGGSTQTEINATYQLTQ